MKIISGLKSKKGFTLVELVVVIAILAILAAIAIPAVIGIINSANESQMASDAATVDYACKTYYTGVVSGTITSASFSATQSGDVVPGPKDPASMRRSKARNCTVGGALEFMGLYEKMIHRVTDFGYDSGGNIHALSDSSVTVSLTPITGDATLDFEGLNYV